jgi:hypothetical protein
MRKLVVAALVLALGAVPAAAYDPEDNPGLEIGNAVATMYANFLYTPAKIVVAAVGGVGGALAGVLTGGDQTAAYAFWVPMMGGDYFLRPGNFDGSRCFAFFGSDYDDQPSAANAENDTTYGYEALYN